MYCSLETIFSQTMRFLIIWALGLKTAYTRDFFVF